MFEVPGNFRDKLSIRQLQLDISEHTYTEHISIAGSHGIRNSHLELYQGFIGREATVLTSTK